MVKDIITMCCIIGLIIGIILGIYENISRKILCKNEFKKIKIGDRYKRTVADFDDQFSEPITVYYEVIDKKKVDSRRYVRLYILNEVESNKTTEREEYLMKTERIEYLLDSYEKC